MYIYIIYRYIICKYTYYDSFLPLRCSLFFLGIIFKMKSQSNIIPFDFVSKIKFDRDFILKMMQKKEGSISGETVTHEVHFFLQLIFVLTSRKNSNTIWDFGRMKQQSVSGQTAMISFLPKYIQSNRQSNDISRVQNIFRKIIHEIKKNTTTTISSLSSPFPLSLCLSLSVSLSVSLSRLRARGRKKISCVAHFSITFKLSEADSVFISCDTKNTIDLEIRSGCVAIPWK